MKRALQISLLGLLTCSANLALAQDSERYTGWEAGFDVNYRLSNSVDFKGGSNIDIGDDFGLALSFGYRFNPHVELQFAFDWAQLDYRATLQSGTVSGLRTTASGTMESFTLFGKVAYNFLDRPITPFVTGGIGYAFIDTNIPNGNVQVGCWWDPWYGYICTPYQSTKTTDAFAYVVGAGLRWDTSSNLGFRLAYESQFLDFSRADGTPNFDMIKLGVVFKY